MDEHRDLSELQQRDPDRDRVRPPRLDPADVRLLTFASYDQIAEIYARYCALTFLRDHPMQFFAQLRRMDAWFVEAADQGLIYLTEIVPHVGARANWVFWDGKLYGNRKEILRGVFKTAFELFDLPRLSGIVPAGNFAMRDMFEKLGFTQEGRVRKGWIGERELRDALLFGVLREETTTWPLLRLG